MTTDGEDDAEKKSEWPNHIPPCCPPADATDLDQVLYHLAYLPTTNPENFKCAAERNAYKNLDPCQRTSLSCWTDTKYLTEVLLPMPLNQGKEIVKATLTAAHGKWKLAPTLAQHGHRSVWFRAEAHARLHEIFER